ncbi:MAG: CaiB/BaiF CoA transferase family protein [Dehalococcoidia bacterium]
MGRPLDGVRVTDLTRAAAGPVATMILADLGAEVIKVEPPGGDITRVLSGPNLHGESYEFVAFNRNKKSIVLDLKSPGGKEALIDLVRVSDVLCNNFRPDVMERLGLGYESIKQINPRLIYSSVSGFGHSGPYSQRPCTDPIAFGYSGLLSLTGEPGRPPVKPIPPIVDLTTGIYGAAAIMAALIETRKTGVGRRVDLAMLDVAVSLSSFCLIWYTMGGGILEAMNAGHPGIVPYGVYRTKDNYIALGPCWPRIVHVLGVEHVASDTRFATRESRIKNREALDAIISQLLEEHPTDYWLDVFQAEGIQVAPINTVEKVVEDPQVMHNGILMTLPHPSGGSVTMPGNPIRIEGTDGQDVLAPTLEQHTQEVLSGVLGYSPERIAALIAEHRGRESDSRFRATI